MPILDTTLSRLRKYLGYDIDIEELEEDLFRIGFELDSYKQSNGDYELKVEITPDRPDCLSAVGLARALALYKGIRKPKVYSAEKSDGFRIYVDKSVTEVRPYIAAFVARGIKLMEEDLLELIWTQEKLHATFCRDRRKASIGFYPFSKISWPLKYYAEAPDRICFKPLGIDKVMNGIEILKEHPTGQKYASLLSGKEKYPLFVDARGNVLSMPPIINSKDYGEIEIGISDLLVETTGTHKESMMQTINILATILHDMGAKIYSVEIVYPDGHTEVSPYFKENIAHIDLDYVEKMLGIEINAEKVRGLLERMGYTVRRIDGRIIHIEIPPYRTDIFHDIDIVDDIARAYGFDNFDPELTPVFTVGARLACGEFIDFIRDVMTGLGFAEIFTYSLTSTEDQFTKMRLDVPKNIVRIAGAKEARLNMVRHWLLPEALKALAENKASEYPIKMFEVSDVVELNEKLEAGSCNKTHMVILISDTKANYTQIRSCVDYLLELLGVRAKIIRENHKSFIEGRCAAIYLKNRRVGVIGEVHPEVLINFGLSMPTVAAEIDLSEVLNIEVNEVDWA